MSKKNTGPQVVTGNDLLSGDVIFWTGGDWSRDPADARTLATPPEQEAALATAEADPGRVVGPYLAAVQPAGFVRLRERIRTTGPTIAYTGRPEGLGA